MYNLFELPENFLTHKYSDAEKAHYNNIIFDAINSPDKLNEDLTDKQKAKVDKMDTSYRGYPEHDAVFGKGVDRIVLPYDDSKDPLITSSNFRTTPKIANINAVHHHMVFDELHKKGYVVDNYLSGLTHHIDTPNRKIKIRKALENIGVADTMTRIYSKPKYKVSETGKILTDKHGNKIVSVEPKPLTLGQVYDADPVRSAAKTPKQIVITRNKYDVCGMSTDRGWSSCMNMVDGSNKHYLPQDIYHGTATAYLTKVGDDGVKNPIGRINLKKFQSIDDHVIYRAEKRQYGMIPKSFISQTDDFTKEKYPSKPGVYLKPSELYNDDGESMKVEGMEHLTHHELITHAPKIAEAIIHNGRNAQQGLSDPEWGDNNAEQVKDDTLDTLDKLHKHLSKPELANVVIHHIADHSYKEDGNRQNEYRTKFSENYTLDDIDGDDAIHHWAIKRLGQNYDVDKGIKEMPVDQKIVNLDKIHNGMEHTEDNDHEALKDVHASMINSAFLDHPDSHELHAKILNHMFAPKNQNYYDNLIDTNSTHLDKVHPVELTKNPRTIHHIFDSDTSMFPHGDVWDTKGAVEHMGKHADHKLADHIIHHEDASEDSQRDFVRGLNKNTNGEKISHQLSDDMLLSGGEYHGKGELLPITKPHELTYAMQGGHRSRDYATDDSTHLGKYVALASTTAFKSVYDKIKNRTATDLNHPDIIQALKDNWEMRPKQVTESKKTFRDSILEAYSRVTSTA